MKLPRLAGTLAMFAMGSPAFAGDGAPTSICFAGFLREIITDRTRMIQATCLVVLIGIGMLWWRK